MLEYSGPRAWISDQTGFLFHSLPAAIQNQAVWCNTLHATPDSKSFQAMWIMTVELLPRAVLGGGGLTELSECFCTNFFYKLYTNCNETG